MNDNNLMNLKLTHPNFYLRPLQHGDEHRLLAFELKNRSHVTPTAGTRPESFYTLETQRRSVERSILAFEHQTMFRFLILKDEDTLLGVISLNDVILSPMLMSCFLGYYVGQDVQGQGIATQAIKLICDYGFKVLKLHRIEAGVMPHNLASQRVLEKNGFVREGLARKNVNIAGKWEDHLTYGLINPYE